MCPAVENIGKYSGTFYTLIYQTVHILNKLNMEKSSSTSISDNTKLNLLCRIFDEKGRTVKEITDNKNHDWSLLLVGFIYGTNNYSCKCCINLSLW